MKKLSFLSRLPNDDNDYQQEQAAAADKSCAGCLGVDVKIVHANNDAGDTEPAVADYIQGPAASRPMLRGSYLLRRPISGSSWRTRRIPARLSHSNSRLLRLPRTRHEPLMTCCLWSPPWIPAHEALGLAMSLCAADQKLCMVGPCLGVGRIPFRTIERGRVAH